MVLDLRHIDAAVEGDTENSISSDKESKSSQIKEYGVFGHISDKKFYDFEAIRKEIVDDTNRIAGDHGVSRTPIILTIYSPSVIDLTLVDLPGIVSVTSSDQTSSLKSEIMSLVHEYASQENSIILAICEAHVDLANANALDLARELDPEGVRTIGVLTKLDMMDRGTDGTYMM